MTRRPRAPLPFSRILNRLMAEKGMSVREAARVARVGPSTISSWRAGANPEDLMAVRRLAEALGVPFLFLLTGEDERQAHCADRRVYLQDERELFTGTVRVTIHEIVPGVEGHLRDGSTSDARRACEGERQHERGLRSHRDL